MKDGVAEAQMAGARDLGEALQQRVRLAGDELGQDLLVQALEQGCVAVQEAAVEQRDGELDVVLVKARAVVDACAWWD